MTAFRAILALWAGLGMVGAARAAEAFEVPLTVRESAGAARAGEPISGGVPLPRGRFPKGQSLALFRADGSEVPCQFAPLVVETDGTLRWVLLDFQDDLPARATRRYVLRAAAPQAEPAVSLRIRQEGKRGQERMALPWAPISRSRWATRINVNDDIETRRG